MADPRERSAAPADLARAAGAAAADPARELAMVRDYLARHPDFLQDHPDVIADLTPPGFRETGTVLDLQRFMLDRLRTQVTDLKSQHRALLTVSRAHLTSQQRIHAAVLAVIAAPSFELLIQAATTDLATLLDIDVVTIAVESVVPGPRDAFPCVQLLPKGMVQRLLGRGDAHLEDEVQGDPMLFGAGAGLVRSEALLRLPIENGPAGLLALGSRRPARFRAGQSTDLLCFLARTVAVTIRQWLAS